jgi:hypothetical protein
MAYGYLYASRKEKEKALEIYKEKNFHIFSLLGMKNDAIDMITEWTEDQLKQKRSHFHHLSNSLYFNNIRSDPRFQEILAQHKELYEENLRKYGDIDI